jgi:hypothetical protein
VKIPSDFVGPIRHKNGNGSTTFSDAVRKHLVTTSIQNGLGCSFVGDFASSGYGDGEGWTGDDIELESKNGSIKVYFVDEESKSEPGLFSKLGSLFGM